MYNLLHCILLLSLGPEMAFYKVPGQYMYKKDLMKYPSFPAAVLDRVPNFKFYPEDVLVATYPKSG